MVEALFKIHTPDEFLETVAEKNEITFAEEFREKYFIYPAGENTSLELLISEEGNKLLGINHAEDYTEVVQYPLQTNLGNLKEILTMTLGLSNELEVRQTVYEAGAATFSICRVEDHGYFVRLESYGVDHLNEMIAELGLDIKNAEPHGLAHLAHITHEEDEE